MMKKQEINCPTCHQKNTWKSENPFRPFCSDRCKLIDLGAWANEEHRVPGEPISPEDSVSSDDENNE